MSNFTDQLSAAGVVCWTREEYEARLRSWGCMPKGLIYQIEGSSGYFVGSGSSDVADNCIPTKDMLGLQVPEGGTAGQYLTIVDGLLEWTDLPTTPQATATGYGTVSLSQIESLAEIQACRALIEKGVPIYANCVDTLANSGVEFLTTGANGLYLNGALQSVVDGYQVTCIGSGDVWTFTDGEWSMGNGVVTGQSTLVTQACGINQQTSSGGENSTGGSIPSTPENQAAPENAKYACIETWTDNGSDPFQKVTTYYDVVAGTVATANGSSGSITLDNGNITASECFVILETYDPEALGRPLPSLIAERSSETGTKTFTQLTWLVCVGA